MRYPFLLPLVPFWLLYEALKAIRLDVASN